MGTRVSGTNRSVDSAWRLMQTLKHSLVVPDSYWPVVGVLWAQSVRGALHVCVGRSGPVVSACDFYRTWKDGILSGVTWSVPIFNRGPINL